MSDSAELQAKQREIERMITQEDLRDLLVGYEQDTIKFRELQARVDSYEAQAQEYIDEGRFVPKSLQAQLDGARGSLERQKRAYQLNQAKHGCLEQSDAMRQGKERDEDYAQMAHLREVDMATAFTDAAAAKWHSLRAKVSAAMQSGKDPEVADLKRLDALAALLK